MHNKEIIDNKCYKQFNLFEDYTNFDLEKETEKKLEKQEEVIQNIIIRLKNKYGKNAILKGMNLSAGATTIQRNNQIGGHNA